MNQRPFTRLEIFMLTLAYFVIGLGLVAIVVGSGVLAWGLK